MSAEFSSAAAECQQISAKILAALSMPYLLPRAATTATTAAAAAEESNGLQSAPIEHHCTASLGATLFKGQALCWQDLMKKADAAMYQAKAAGRNRVQFDASLN